MRRCGDGRGGNRPAPFEWEVLTLQDVLPYLCKVCPPFRQLLEEVYAEYGADWRAILYCDGLTPGAVLSPENNRKSIVWYATLLEFGHRLCHQELWTCIAGILTKEAKLVPAQVSGLTRLVVRDMVCGDRAANTAGIILDCAQIAIEYWEGIGIDGMFEIMEELYTIRALARRRVWRGRLSAHDKTSVLNLQSAACDAIAP